MTRQQEQQLETIRRQIARRDFTGLRGDGERLVFARARELGVQPAALMRQWEAEGAAATATSPTPQPRRITAVPAVDEVDDDEDERDEPISDLDDEEEQDDKEKNEENLNEDEKDD